MNCILHNIKKLLMQSQAIRNEEKIINLKPEKRNRNCSREKLINELKIRWRVLPHLHFFKTFSFGVNEVCKRTKVVTRTCSTKKNKAGYTAQDAPSTRPKITRDRGTDRRTDGRTDGRTDTTSYRDATAHLKRDKKLQAGRT